MPDNSAFLARIYELSGAKTPTELAEWVGRSLTTVLNWQSGKFLPQLTTLQRIRQLTGEDLTPLVQTSARPDAHQGPPVDHSKVEESFSYSLDPDTRAAIAELIPGLEAIYRARKSEDPDLARAWDWITGNVKIFARTAEQGGRRKRRKVG